MFSITSISKRNLIIKYKNLSSNLKYLYTKKENIWISVPFYFATWLDYVSHSRNVVLIDRQMRDENACATLSPTLLPRSRKEWCSKRNPLFPVVEHRGRSCLQVCSNGRPSD